MIIYGRKIKVEIQTLDCASDSFGSLKIEKGLLHD